MKNKRMGKYMKKKSKVAVVVEGVRTRAKTLALQQRLNSGLGAVVVDESSFCYLQLRSRRLEKSSPPPSKQKQQQHRDREKTSCGEGDNRNQSQDKGSSSLKELENVASNEVGAPEASSGDNIYIADFEPRDRSTRESTPCSFIRGGDTIGTPGSITRLTGSPPATNQGVQNGVQRIMPTANEIEEFFATAEKQQRRLFIEKYNFDIVNDLPLPGRYGWVQVVP